MRLPQKKILALIISSLGFAALPEAALGHGALESPKARQYECYTQGNHWNPGAMKDAACKAALLNSSGEQKAFDNWNGYTGFAVPPHGLEQAKQAVPNGMLCTGSNPGYSGFAAARPDWKKTELKPDSNGNVTMRYRYTAKHAPSFTEFYINKKGIDSTSKPLGWDDVELLKRFDIQAGDQSEYHDIQVEIPADRIGNAIIFTRWQRIDAAGEGFYGCSDVNIQARDGTIIDPPEPPEPPEPPVDDWINKGTFITNAYNPTTGEEVRFRLMGGTRGDNIIDVKIKITDSNILNSKWVIDLAKELNRDYSNLVQIGQQDSNKNITFNEGQPRNNHVYVSDNSHGYAIEVVKGDVPVITLDRTSLTAIATINTTYDYTVIGTSDQPNVSWVWKNVSGNKDIVARPANQAKTQIYVPAGIVGSSKAIFELTGTTSKGESGKATLTVDVIAPSVAPSGPSSIATGQSANFRAKANFDFNQGEVSYDWALLKGDIEVADGIDQNGNVTTNLAAGDYQVRVTAHLKNGERKATGTTMLNVFAGGSEHPAYNASIAYPTKCTKVNHKGSIWQNQWYVNAGQEEPGNGGQWGAWRGEKASENTCK